MDRKFKVTRDDKTYTLTVDRQGVIKKAPFMEHCVGLEFERYSNRIKTLYPNVQIVETTRLEQLSFNF